MILSVEHLSILAAEPEEAYCAFKYTTLPQMTSPEISCTNGGSSDGIALEHWDELHIIDFFGQSACALTSSSLRKVHISDDQLIHFLRLMPSLEFLHLEEPAKVQV